MGCQSIAGLPPALNSPVPIYTPGWREALWEWSVLPKNTTQCPRPGPEPGPLNHTNHEAKEKISFKFQVSSFKFQVHLFTLIQLQYNNKKSKKEIKTELAIHWIKHNKEESV